MMVMPTVLLRDSRILAAYLVTATAASLVSCIRLCTNAHTVESRVLRITLVEVKSIRSALTVTQQGQPISLIRAEP